MKPGDLVTIVDLPPEREEFGGVEVYHICMDDIVEESSANGLYSDHFLVPSNTPGILIQKGMIEWRVLFPHGIGWIDTHWLTLPDH